VEGLPGVVFPSLGQALVLGRQDKAYEESRGIEEAEDMIVTTVHHRQTLSGVTVCPRLKQTILYELEKRSLHAPARISGAPVSRHLRSNINPVIVGCTAS
jgi:hypothetical protein